MFSSLLLLFTFNVLCFIEEIKNKFQEIKSPLLLQQNNINTKIELIGDCKNQLEVVDNNNTSTKSQLLFLDKVSQYLQQINDMSNHTPENISNNNDNNTQPVYTLELKGIEEKDAIRDLISKLGDVVINEVKQNNNNNNNTQAFICRDYTQLKMK